MTRMGDQPSTLTMNSLAGARHKFGRAEGHAYEFQREVWEWVARRYASQPARFTKRYEREHQRFVYAIGDMTIAAPTDWSLLIGDAIHNYRCVLDYIAWTLVQMGTEPKPLNRPKCPVPYHHRTRQETIRRG